MAIMQYPTVCHRRWKVRTFANVDVELLATGHQGRNLLLQRGCKLTGYVALLVQPCKPRKKEELQLQELLTPLPKEVLTEKMWGESKNYIDLDNWFLTPSQKNPAAMTNSLTGANND